MTSLPLASTPFAPTKPNPWLPKGQLVVSPVRSSSQTTTYPNPRRLADQPSYHLLIQLTCLYIQHNAARNPTTRMEVHLASYAKIQWNYVTAYCQNRINDHIPDIYRKIGQKTKVNMAIERPLCYFLCVGSSNVYSVCHHLRVNHAWTSQCTRLESLTLKMKAII